MLIFEISLLRSVSLSASSQYKKKIIIKVFRHTTQQTTEVLWKRKFSLYEENKVEAVQVCRNIKKKKKRERRL